VLVHKDPVNVIRIFVKPVIAELILDIKQDQQAAGQSYSHAADVDDGKDLVFSMVSPVGWQY